MPLTLRQSRRKDSNLRPAGLSGYPPLSQTELRPEIAGLSRLSYSHFVDMALHHIFDIIQCVISVIVCHPVPCEWFRACFAFAEPETGDFSVLPDDSHHPAMAVDIQLHSFVPLCRCFRRSWACCRCHAFKERQCDPLADIIRNHGKCLCQLLCLRPFLFGELGRSVDCGVQVYPPPFVFACLLIM